MKVCDILEHFLSRSPWVDRATTVDRVIAGDPSKDVDACAVAWMPSLALCREVIEKGFELLICHEPTFWDHFDALPSTAPGAAEKLAVIEAGGLTILRNHDCWDRWPDAGVTDAWGRFLGLPGPPAATAAGRAQHRYDIDPVPFAAFAADVAARTAAVGEPTVEVAGDGRQIVSRIGVGTGCITNLNTFIEMGCDGCILCDDGAPSWRDVQHALDLGLPIICVNHGTCEEPGVTSMAEYVNANLPGVRAEHFAQGCLLQRVGADGVFRPAPPQTPTNHE